MVVNCAVLFIVMSSSLSVVLSCLLLSSGKSSWHLSVASLAWETDGVINHKEQCLKNTELVSWEFQRILENPATDMKNRGEGIVIMQLSVV